MLLRRMTFTLKVMQPLVYGYPSNSIVETHFIIDCCTICVICKVLNKYVYP